MIGWRRPRGYRHFLFFCNFVAVKRRRCRGYLATALRLVGGVAAVIRQLRCGYTVNLAALPRLLGNFVAVSRQLRCGYTVNLAALPRLVGITLAVMRLFAAVIGCGGIQPERLNAEGFSPRALSRGWSVSATLGMPYDPRKSV